jgi:hypothetical protein
MNQFTNEARCGIVCRAIILVLLSFSQSYGWEKIGDIGVGECDSTCERIGTDIIVDWHVTVLGVTAIAVVV